MDHPLLLLIGINALVLLVFWRWLAGARSSDGDPDGTVVENQFMRLMQRVDSVWKDELSTAHIRKIEHEIEEEQRELFDRAVAEEDRIKTAIKQEDTSEIRQIKNRYDKLRGYELAIDRLTAGRKRLYEKQQMRHVWSRLNEMLDERFVRWLQWTVLVLIVVVLVVLFVEISVGYEALNEKQLSVLG